MGAEECSRICRQASTPESSGIMMSMTTRSVSGWSAMKETASLPLAAQETE